MILHHRIFCPRGVTVGGATGLATTTLRLMHKKNKAAVASLAHRCWSSSSGNNWPCSNNGACFFSSSASTTFSFHDTSKSQASSLVWKQNQFSFSSEAQNSHRFNADNMAEHHETHEQPPQEWAVFNGKIPVLQEKPSSSEQQQQRQQQQQQHQHGNIQPPSPHWALYGDMPRTSLLMELTDRVGILHDILRYFWKYDVNICRIESRPAKLASPTGQRRAFDFFVDMEGSPTDQKVANLLDALQPMVDKLLILDEKKVQWFPRHISELDLIANRTLDAGVDLIAEDHPGFHDPVYRQRRAALTEAALNHSWDQPIPRIDYTEQETAVWTAVWDKMEDLWQQYACREFLQSMELMKVYCGYSRDNIPQQEDISSFLKRRTNFRMRPVAGLLSSRDFLNGLAFRVFFCTQYIRHQSKPLYTPEPDICHELLGHAPMFANPSFADFSQAIGLASLGASDEDVTKLAHCYWHSVEFGLCREDGKNKAYGAGLLSSFGELEYACSDEHPGAAEDGLPEIKPWDPDVASRTEFPITTYQPVYFLAESLEDAKQRMREYCEDLPRPFFAKHNMSDDTIHIDRPVRRTKGCPEMPGANGDNEENHQGKQSL